MSKIGHYLQDHITGEVVTAPDVRRYFATDCSIFTMAPALIVYPHDENDVRKVARFSWQLAERNRLVPITARGAGTDQTGAALGSGIMLVFPAHMNRIVEFDSKSGVMTVEPGVNYGKIQQTLLTHGRFLPPYPSSLEYSTLGGAVANNASGEKSVKYGDTRGFIRSLRVVLANGEVIHTGRLSKKDLNKKLGLTTFEGEVYRGIDALTEENMDTISASQPLVTQNSAGYNLYDVRRPDGSIDLTPLFIGSQGTLGIITEVTFDTEPHNPETTLFAASFDDLKSTQAAINELRLLPELPSAIEMIDGHFLERLEQVAPNLLKDSFPKPYPAAVLLVEFDDNERQQKKLVRRAQKIFDRHAASAHKATDMDSQSRVWKIRQASATLTAHSDGRTKALPIIGGGIVPPQKFAQLLNGLYAILKSNKIPPAVWGHAGEGAVHVQPYMDLAELGDRQRAFRVMDEYNKLVISLGGSVSAEQSDGRLRAPYLKELYGDAVYGLFEKVKQVFDPYGTLNPGVKVGVTLDDIKPLVRGEFTMSHLYDHLPRS